MLFFPSVTLILPDRTFTPEKEHSDASTFSELDDSTQDPTYEVTKDADFIVKKKEKATRQTMELIESSVCVSEMEDRPRRMPLTEEEMEERPQEMPYKNMEWKMDQKGCHKRKMRR